MLLALAPFLVGPGAPFVAMASNLLATEALSDLTVKSDDRFDV